MTIGGQFMKIKSFKSWRTLAEESKTRRKPNLTSVQIEKANKIFEEIETKQEQLKENAKRR